METLFFFISLSAFLFFAAFGMDLALGNRSTEYLKDIPLLNDPKAPSVSVVIPARNEEKNIEQALQSVLDQDYENYEVIVVDDRSTDRTGAILDRMARTHRRLRVIHVSELPKGWLGKNHASHLAARQAGGEFLLFTDADVVMDPTTVGRAVRYMVEKHFDHITIGPELKMPGLLLRAFSGTLVIFLNLYARPWKAKDPKSGRFIGIGAFNLVRAEVYRAVGAHQAIAMRPDDDMKFGKLIKKHGYRQTLLFGEGMISVEWYCSLAEFISGLEKNAFAGLEYNLPLVIGGTFIQFLFAVWPFAAVFVTAGATQLVSILAVLAIVLMYRDNARFHYISTWFVSGFPFAVLLLIYIIWNSALTTLRNDGISWRGTHYPLSDLKANKV